MRPSNPRGESRISVDGLAVPIDVEDGHGTLSPPCAFLPQRSGPTCERFCERSIRSNRGQLCQKSLGVAVAVGEASTGQQCQSLTGVAPQIPCPSESHGLQKEQRDQLTAQGRRLQTRETQRWSSSQQARCESCLQVSKQIRPMGSR